MISGLVLGRFEVVCWTCWVYAVGILLWVWEHGVALCHQDQTVLSYWSLACACASVRVETAVLARFVLIPVLPKNETCA